MSETKQKPIIGISVGDLNGIGMEIIIKTFDNPDMMELCTPVVFASSKAASYHRNAIDRKNFNFNICNSIGDIHPDRPNLVNAWKEEVILDLGKESAVVGSYAHKSLAMACEALENNHVQALVTAPIHKKTIQSQDFKFTGHTDYLEARFKAKAMMMLISEEMRMALATVHIPIEKVSETISAKLVQQKIRQLHDILRHDFHIEKGKIAVLSLDPHAGDNGVIGNKDQEIIEPTIAKAFNEDGILAYGPFPADSFFGSGRHRKFDAVLAMYHDQGLIPFKSLSFGQGVNYSAGLPIVRTSPDHGTAFEIAGQGVANESSFREAVYLACDLVRNRAVTNEITANPLKTKSRKK